MKQCERRYGILEQSANRIVGKDRGSVALTTGRGKFDPCGRPFAFVLLVRADMRSRFGVALRIDGRRSGGSESSRFLSVPSTLPRWAKVSKTGKPRLFEDKSLHV